ncbi:hypothetical protein CI610_03183 [invertebrate metagenome]|uniref:Uncharacterized protein n=1 Tax=invertebrate metagenome TaxID=1711999 RepID=A0A2H9T3W5_9ZZZZ
MILVFLFLSLYSLFLYPVTLSYDIDPQVENCMLLGINYDHFKDINTRQKVEF